MVSDLKTFAYIGFKIKLDDKYLGQIFASSLATSAFSTVKDRAGQIKGAALEIKQIIEDFQMKAIGGLAAAWDLWEKALIPSLCPGPVRGSETSERPSNCAVQYKIFIGKLF